MDKKGCVSSVQRWRFNERDKMRYWLH